MHVDKPVNTGTAYLVRRASKHPRIKVFLNSNIIESTATATEAVAAVIPSTERAQTYYVLTSNIVRVARLAIEYAAKILDTGMSPMNFCTC